MVSFPITCLHCGEQRRHYGSCRCPNAQLDAIAREREQIAHRLAVLNVRESELLNQITGEKPKCVV